MFEGEDEVEYEEEEEEREGMEGSPGIDARTDLTRTPHSMMVCKGVLVVKEEEEEEEEG